MSSPPDPDLAADMEWTGEAWAAPLLITGCARTGTTALTRLLSTHDRICMFNEYSLYTNPPEEGSVWHRIRVMRDDNPPPDKISPDAGSLRSRLAAELPSPVSDETATNWIFGLLRKPVAVYGDKMPLRYLQVMEEIAQRFPRTRILLTMRDGRAVVASQLRHYHNAVERGITPEHWMQPTVEEAEYLWLAFARIWLRLRASPPAPCLEVRYEQATQSPEALARNICEFVGLDYCRDEFAEFLDGYRPTHVDTWRRELPDIEAHLSDEFCEALRQLGYE